MATDLDAPLVFPVGHFMGPFHPSPNSAPKHYIVRVGWDTPKLADEAHFDVWALAHGLPARIGTVPWTRDAIVRAARDAGMTDPEPILDTLLGLGLIVEVVPGTPEAVDFAKRYRVQSLLIGLGNGPDEPVLDGIGLPGLPPLVRVEPRVFELWQWAHLWPDLWSACEALAAAAHETGGDSEESQPERGLDFALSALRTLIAHNAAYLDTARQPAQRPA